MVSLSTSPAEPVILDLDVCAREPIHIPGSIQPHGALLAVDEGVGLCCTQMSINAAAVLRRPPGAAPLLGSPLRDSIGAEFHALVEETVAGGADPALSSPLTTDLHGRPFSVSLHRHDGVLLIELEPLDLPANGRSGTDAAFTRHHRRLQAGLTAMRGAPDLAALYPIIARTVADLAGFDRVMVYRFDRDWHGEVVGEARSSPEVDSYLGLHYPSSDIPVQARLLYEKSWLRLIPTVDYRPATIEPAANPKTGRPLDLSFAALRSVSPIHLEYLRNMGVAASMSVSLLVDGRLWGLIACHHGKPCYLPASVRAACELFGQTASTEIAAKQEARALAELARAKTVQTQFFDVISGASDVFGALGEYAPQLLDFMSASGAAIWLEGRCSLHGACPPRDVVESIIRVLNRLELDPLLATDHLAGIMPEAVGWRDTASGLLAVRLSRVEKNYVLWFRPETVTSVKWAGNPHKPAEETDRLHPRRSFAEWKEIVLGHSRPWAEPEIAGARELHQALNALVLRRAEGLLRFNRELERKNTDLNSFAHIAAHDLREPLRGIRNFSEFVREDYGADMPPDCLRRVETITSLSDRMGDLLEALLHYSEVGRIELRTVWTNLDAVLDEALANLESTLAGSGLEVHRPRPLPSVEADPVMVREVFSNLLTNAVKYSASPEKWIEWTWREGRPEDNERGPVISVRDNGIGIKAKHHEEIFQIFRRLHGRGEYGGGSGVGLAIVKNVIERHGGRVWLESEPEQGTTFFFTLR